MNFREHGTAQRRMPHLYTRLKDSGCLWTIQSVSRILKAGTITTIQKCSTA
nr:MAG TPA: hypothetical protein [Caudoviricetes sp.]